MAARKEILDFIKAENQPNQHERKDDPRKLMQAILNIYIEQRANQITLRNDIDALLYERDLHQKPNNSSVILGLNPLQTEIDHKIALFDIGTVIDRLIYTAHKWGVDFDESELKKYENVKWGKTCLAERIRFVYGTNENPTPYDIFNEPEKRSTIIKLLEKFIGDLSFSTEIFEDEASTANENQGEQTECDLFNEKLKELPIFEMEASSKLPKISDESDGIFVKLQEKGIFRDEVEEWFDSKLFINSIRRAYFGLDIYKYKTYATNLLNYFSRYFKDSRKYKEIGATYIIFENVPADPNHLKNGKQNSPINKLLKELENIK